MRESGRKLGLILKHLGSMAQPGVSAEDLDRVAREMIKDEGAEPAFLGYKPRGAPRPFPAALCVSVNDAVEHGIPGEQVLEDGDIVSLDLGLTYRGYVTDASVLILVGEPHEGDMRLKQAVEEALAKGIAAAKAGNRVGDIGAAVESVAARYGYGIFHELGGHGVGRHVHEDPFIPNFGDRGRGAELKEDMVLAIEPMFAVGAGELVVDPDGYTLRSRDGSRTGQAEHTIIVTSDGGEIVTLPN